MSFCAFSANVGQWEAPSSLMGLICLPSTPPEALISAIASFSESRTVTSLIAMVPESELSRPTLTVSPLTSIFAALSDDVPAASVFAPHAERATTAVSAAPPARKRRRRIRELLEPLDKPTPSGDCLLKCGPQTQVPLFPGCFARLSRRQQKTPLAACDLHSETEITIRPRHSNYFLW